MSEDEHEHDLEPMDDDLLSLLANERARPGAPAEAKAEVQRGLAALIDGHRAPPHEAPDASPPAPPTPPTAPRTGLPRWVGPLALMVGAGAGALLHAQLAPPRVVYVDRPAVSSVAPALLAVPSASSVAEQVPSVAVSALVSVPSPVAPIRSAPPAAPSASAAARDGGAQARPEDDALRRERAVLEIARTALGRGDAASALDALARHAAEHPAGKLAEERDAMTIQALVSAGRKGEARERAEAFRQHHPRSFFLPSIDASLGGL
jgi:hypothetical protein